MDRPKSAPPLKNAHLAPDVSTSTWADIAVDGVADTATAMYVTVVPRGGMLSVTVPPTGAWSATRTHPLPCARQTWL